jgi:selenocysteine lyase/cysteine desulfurase
VRQRIAALIGAKTDECVLVPNASYAISTVLRNIEWQKDDVIVACEPNTFPFQNLPEIHALSVSVVKTTYNSVERTAQYISDTPPHPAVSTVALTFPTSSAKVLAQFRDHLRRLPRKDGQKIVAIIDSIASLPALLLPWKEMVQICKEESVLSIIDAAHSIGQEINLDLNKADPDFWTSVCAPSLALSPELRLTFIVCRIATNGFTQSGRAQSYTSHFGALRPVDLAVLYLS